MVGFIRIQREAITQKILLTSWVVKGENTFGKRLNFQIQIEDLRLKCRVLGEYPETKSSGEPVEKDEFGNLTSLPVFF